MSSIDEQGGNSENRASHHHEAAPVRWPRGLAPIQKERKEGRQLHQCRTSRKRPKADVAVKAYPDLVTCIAGHVTHAVGTLSISLSNSCCFPYWKRDERRNLRTNSVEPALHTWHDLELRSKLQMLPSKEGGPWSPCPGQNKQTVQQLQDLTR